jgi:DNA repair exonuclease SbcCD ATPase subunit
MSENKTSATSFFVQNGNPSPMQHGLSRKQPMVELIESNTKLNQDLDRVRKEYKQCLHNIEATKENIERIIKVDRLEIQEQIKIAVQERENLLKTLEAVQSQELIKQQQQEEKSKVARDQAHDRLRVAQEALFEQQNQFRQHCVEYRSKIQQLAFQGECVGLKNHLAPLLACAILHGHHPRENVTQSREDTTHIVANDTHRQEQWNQNFDHIVTILSELTGVFDEGKDSCDDVELNEALQELDRQKTRTKEAHGCLEEALKEKETVLQSQEKRALYKKGLQAQYQRLNDDVSKLRSQITMFQQQTEEANKMTSIYRQGKEGRISDVSVGIFSQCFVLCSSCTIAIEQMSRNCSRSGKMLPC